MPKGSTYPGMSALTGAEKIIGVQGTATETVTTQVLANLAIGQSNTYTDNAVAGVVGGAGYFQQAGTGAVNRTYPDKMKEAFSVRDFGAVGNGVANDAPAILAAFAQAQASSSKVIFPAGVYKFNGTTTLNIDLGYFEVEGQGGVTIDCSGFTGATAVAIYSSLSYPSTSRNAINCVKGIEWLGNKTAGRNGLVIGHATNTYNGQCSIYNCSWRGFDINVQTISNAWRYAFYNCNFTDALTWIWQSVSGSSNAGEVMDFYHCMLFDGAGDIQLAASNQGYNFHGCSILNTTLFVTGSNNVVRFFGGNIENPGSSSYFPYVSITGVNNHVSMAGTTITLDNTSAWTDVPFKVGVNNKMSFVDILIPINNFPFETTSGIRAFCTGAGLVQATNSAYAQTSGGWKIPWASNANMLRNGDFELGTTAGWTVTTSGAAPTTFTAVTSNVHLGTYAGQAVTGVGTSQVQAYQDIPCQAGRYVVAGGWANVITAGSGTAGFMQVVFYDQSGAVISTLSNGISTAGYTVIGVSLGGYAPPGTVKARFLIITQNGATVNYDDLILNIL